jgi:hypothetical protein
MRMRNGIPRYTAFVHMMEGNQIETEAGRFAFAGTELEKRR